jgi:F0F1-type ATP synthase membrane subunit c/vacuolar-type H+-ATPase subunit K
MKNHILMVLFAAVMLLYSCKEENYYTEEEFDLKASQMEQIGPLFDAIARQPDFAGQLIHTAENLYTSYTELLPISDQAINQRGKARGLAFAELFNAIARQPEAFEKLDRAAEQFLGPYSADYISDELLQVTKAYAMGALYESLARQPEANDLFAAVCEKYLNFQMRLN